MALTKTDPVPKPAKVIPPDTPCERVRAEIAKYPDWDVSIITAIAKAESRAHSCDPLGHNLTMTENHGICVGSYGALQVGCLHYREGENRDDLKTNVAVAHRVWQQQGYTAWTRYRDGTYQNYLK